MLMVNVTPAFADYTLSQLREIERMILSRDFNALYRFLQENPEVLVGNDPLAQELRTLVSDIEAGVIGDLGAAQTARTDDAGTSSGTSTY